MSLIFGVNLCDRIYLSGDTRLTRKNEKGEIIDFNDNLIKVEPYSPNIVIGAAGDAALASYLLKEIHKSDIINSDIRTFRKKVKDFITPLVDKYWREIDPKAHTCFIIGGLNRNDRKKLDRKIVFEKIMSYSRDTKVQMNAKPLIFNTISGEKRYPELCDSHLFSIEIFPPMDFVIEDAEWGEYLAFGPKGITKESIPKEILGKLEFDAKYNDISQDTSLLCGLIIDIAEKKNQPTIGGSVTTMVLSESISGLVTGGVWRLNLKTGEQKFISEIRIVDNKPYRVTSNGELKEIHSLLTYTNSNGFKMEI